MSGQKFFWKLEANFFLNWSWKVKSGSSPNRTEPSMSEFSELFYSGVQIPTITDILCSYFLWIQLLYRFILYLISEPSLFAIDDGSSLFSFGCLYINWNSYCHQKKIYGSIELMKKSNNWIFNNLYRNGRLKLDGQIYEIDSEKKLFEMNWFLKKIIVIELKLSIWCVTLNCRRLLWGKCLVGSCFFSWCLCLQVGPN